MSNQEDLQAVKLDEKAENKEEVSVADPWAVDETAAVVEESNPDREEGAPGTDTEEALSKLKVSGARLGSALSATTSDIDKKLGISNVITSFGTKVREVDEQTKVSGHVTAAVKNVSTTLGALLSGVDDKLQIYNKSKEIGGTLGTSFSTVLSSDPVKKTTTAVKDFDETHGVTRSTANTLAAGVDLLANAIGGGESEKPAADESLLLSARVDSVEKVDSDGIPSSFQK
mmetsp:Transcript_17986/g.30634  ORF Transcript_17986/g.30634 Transcript_17986/m.30634 type:complete len:229 (-) Transcript_17986:1759-2445(-)